MTKQVNNNKAIARRYGITGLTIHLVGFTIGFFAIGWHFSGVIGPRLDIHSGLSVLAHTEPPLYLLGLGIVVVVAAKVGVPMKYLLVAGAAMGVGLFYKYFPHDLHIASGIGFGLSHFDHLIIGNILTTISVVVLALVMIVYYGTRLQADKVTV